MIDEIVEMILKEARGRVKHDLSYGLHEVMSELSDRTHKIYLSLIDEELREKEQRDKNKDTTVVLCIGDE